MRPPSGGSKFIVFFFYGNSFGIVPEPRSILKKEKAQYYNGRATVKLI